MEHFFRKFGVIALLGLLTFWGSSVFSPDTFVLRASEQNDAKAVNDAGKALGGWSIVGDSYPWYDRSSDSSRFVPFKVEKQQAQRQTNSTFWEQLFYWFVVFVIVIVAVLLFYLLLTLAYLYIPGLRKFTEAGKAEDELRRRIETLPIEAQDDFSDLLGAALKAMQRGDLKRSVVLYFSHLLVLLDENDLIRLHKGKTNHEYESELSRYPSKLPHYQDTMLLFEKTYFGDYPVLHEEFEPVWEFRKLYIDIVKRNSDF